MSHFVARNGWGPQARRAALSITFDNLGEAAEIEAGLWGDQPVGRHYTADFIPELIERLGDVRATYFIEASNVAIYPETIKLWHRAGHEVGIHAWRHEVWDRSPPERRRQILADSIQAMRSIGIEPAGFRPPGGAIPDVAWDEFAAAGLLYCSDLAPPGVRRKGPMVSVPFEWHGVDSYMLETLTAPLRVHYGEQEAPFGMKAWTDELDAMVDAVVEEGGQRTVVFHPMFLAQSPQKVAALLGLIERARDADLWIAPVGEVARFVAALTSITAD